jgi:hypothetical protein
VRHLFTVDFARDYAENIEYAQAGFPGLPEEEQLRAQFCAELDENPALKGTYTVSGTVVDDGMEIYTVEFDYNHPAEDRFHARRIFRCELQETCDRYGMEGSFNIRAKADGTA